ncbi:unnamed protein product, partial [Ectocarpus fasciculatus]
MLYLLPFSDVQEWADRPRSPTPLEYVAHGQPHSKIISPFSQGTGSQRIDFLFFLLSRVGQRVGVVQHEDTPIRPKLHSLLPSKLRNTWTDCTDITVAEALCERGQFIASLLQCGASLSSPSFAMYCAFFAWTLSRIAGVVMGEDSTIYSQYSAFYLSANPNARTD